MLAIYPCRPDDNNEELRFSLRSLINLPAITEVCIVGHLPPWCKPDIFIPGNHHTSGHANVYDNIRIASQHPDVADNICVMNDDFFVTEPVETVETFYRCALADHLDIPRVKRGGWWKDSLATTQVCLQEHGIAAPLSYELHVPLPVEKAAMAETLQMFQHVTPTNPPQWRSLYGNMHTIGGQQRDDVKAYQAGKLNQPYHSTEPRSFPAYRDQLAAMFPTPSRYELGAELAA